MTKPTFTDQVRGVAGSPMGHQRSGFGRSVRFVVLTLSMVAMGCSETRTKPPKKTGNYVFLVGPDKSFTEGEDQRFIVAVAAKYIELDSAPAGVMSLNQFTFAYRYPDLAPVAKDKLAGSNVILETIAWEREGSIRRRIDGSWPNHYLIYNRVVGSTYGMEVRVRTDMPSDESRLLIDEKSETIIECEKVVGIRPGLCRLIHKAGPHLTLDVRFEPALLSKWRNIIQACRKIIKPGASTVY